MRTPAQLAQIPKFVKAGSDATRGKKLDYLANERHPHWKGDKVSYAGIHVWVARHFGRPMKCEFCEDESYHRFEWANISGEYRRDRWDWIRLCVPCHRQQAAGRLLIEVNDI